MTAINPQDESLFTNIKVRRCAAYCSRGFDFLRFAWTDYLSKISPKWTSKVGKIHRLIGPLDWSQTETAAFSGGQQQRLCIARALTVEPEILLLDEPCSALDPIATRKIEELLFQLKDITTVVIVTHNMQKAARLADYTGFFLMGKLIEFSETRKLFQNPSKKETEDYVTGRFG